MPEGWYPAWVEADYLPSALAASLAWSRRKRRVRMKHASQSEHEGRVIYRPR